MSPNMKSEEVIQNCQEIRIPGQKLQFCRKMLDEFVSPPAFESACILRADRVLCRSEIIDSSLSFDNLAKKMLIIFSQLETLSTNSCSYLAIGYPQRRLFVWKLNETDHPENTFLFVLVIGTARNFRGRVRKLLRELCGVLFS